MPILTTSTWQCAGRVVAACALGATVLAQGPPATRSGQERDAGRQGQTTTLSDGRVLLLGGIGPRGPVAAGAIVDPTSKGRPVTMRTPRAWHSATVLPNGRVVVFGGLTADGSTAEAELFDPRQNSFSTVEIPIDPRSGHTATVLTDGRVLFLGGRTASGKLPTSGAIWDPAVNTIVEVHGASPRADHRATLLADGTVLIEGGRDDGGGAPAPEIVFPEQPSAVPAGVAQPEAETMIAGSLPWDGAVDVDLRPTLAVRFSGPLPLAGTTPRAFVLSEGQGTKSPTGPVTGSHSL